MQLPVTRDHDERRIGIFKRGNEFIVITVPLGRQKKSQLSKRSDALVVVKIIFSHRAEDRPLGRAIYFGIFITDASYAGKMNSRKNDVCVSFGNVKIG